MRFERKCEWCGKIFIRYKKSELETARFCSRECVTAWKKIHVFPFHKAPWLSELNKLPGRNAKIARDTAKKRGEKQRGISRGGITATYSKANNRHIHRQVMEQILGRKLSPHEIVHHIDGNRKNNIPENLQLTNKSAHTAHHSAKKIGKVGDAS